MPRTEDLEIEGSVKWNQEYIGKRQYVIEHPDEYITMTGSAVTVILKVREWHRLIKIEVKHTDSAKANGTDALTWFLEKEFFACDNGLRLISYSNSVKSDFIEGFGEKYEYPIEEYTFSFNTTNTDRIYLKIYIQKTR